MHNGKHLYSGLQPASELRGRLCVSERERERETGDGREKEESELTTYKSGETFTLVSSLSSMRQGATGG